MQLFSRNKALAAVSLGALAALGACGDDVTVPVAPAAPVVISISPPSATMNVGERLTFAVSIGGGSATAAPTLASCTSSNTAVITAAVAGSTCSVTAVAPGNATVTAAASTGQAAAAGVSVVAPPAAISGLAISPSATQLAVGGSVTLVPTVNRAATAVNVAYTYTSSATAIATVTAAGVVTAVAPGTATITVTAAGTGTGFSATTLTTAATVTVSDRTAGLTSLQVAPSTVTLSPGATQPITASAQGPQASAATITYGTSAPSVATVSSTGVITAVAAGTATITVTAQTAQSGSFAASSITGLVTVTVSPAAQVAITNITQGMSQNPIDLSNVQDQIQVLLAVQPNGQTVTEANVWVCEPSETVAACATRSGTPAARQSFTASGSQSATVTLFINTAEFAEPNWTTGADASVRHMNGLKTIVATLTTAQTAASTIASNSISQVNFNNPDGWTVRWTAPANRANDAGNITWYGGPSTPDALTPSAQSGTGSFTVVPVIYTPGRTVVQATINLSTACGANITDYARPFSSTYGTAARDTLAGVFRCTAATSTAGMAPQVIGAVDNNNNGYNGTTATPAVARSIFDDFSNIANATAGGFRQSLAYRPNNLYLPHDYQAPTITRLEVRGGGATSVDSGWVNGAYAFNRVIDATTGATSYQINDGAGVGLFATASRNTLFSVCTTPATTAGLTADVGCAAPVKTGGLTSTVTSMGLPEAADLTNQAYYVVAAETDRLGNRRTSVPFGFTPTGLPAVAATDARNTFGVDLTAPLVVAIPNEAATMDVNNPGLAGVRSGIDSIFRAATNTYTATSGDGSSSINATNARFAARTTDERSGFYTCTAAVSCTVTDATQFHLGTFQIVRRRNPNSPLATNDATVENVIATPTATAATLVHVMNGTAVVAGTGVRQFSVNIFGDAARAPSGVTIGSGEEGYYSFSGTLVDRAGNTTTLATRHVAIDNDAPTLNNVILPALYTGGATGGVTIQASDDLEVMGVEMRLGFPATSLGTGITFPRVTNFAATTRTGFFQNPFAALTSNKLATPTGAGQFYAGAVSLPIGFIQDMQVTPATGVVAAPGAGVASKPDAIGARVYDIKALAAPTGGATPVTMANASSAFTNQAIAANQVTTNTVSGAALRKNWGATEVVGGVTNAGAQIGEFVVFNSGTATNATVEFRARALTSSANQPFSAIYVVIRRHDTSNNSYGDYEYRGQATYAGPLDDGGVRYFRYTVPAAAIGALTQGNNVSYAAFTGLDSIRAIGVDASGNALASPAAIPGTTASTNALTSAAQAAVNVFPATATAPAQATTASFSGTGGFFFTRSFATTPVTAAADISADSRIFIGLGAATQRTARIYFSITTATGLTASDSTNTGVVCASSDPTAIEVIGGGHTARLSSSTTLTRQAFCDVRGVTSGGVATVSATITRSAAFAPFTGNTVVATSSPIYAGDPTVAALGAVGALSAFAAVPGSTTGARFATFTIAAPTFAGLFNATNTTMAYTLTNQTASTTSAVSTSVLVNNLTGAATVTVTCSGTQVTNATTFGFHLVGRGTSLLGFSSPISTGTTGAAAVSGTCN